MFDAGTVSIEHCLTGKFRKEINATVCFVPMKTFLFYCESSEYTFWHSLSQSNVRFQLPDLLQRAVYW